MRAIRFWISGQAKICQEGKAGLWLIVCQEDLIVI